MWHLGQGKTTRTLWLWQFVAKKRKPRASYWTIEPFPFKRLRCQLISSSSFVVETCALLEIKGIVLSFIGV
jgi:hypothetical protein